MGSKPLNPSAQPYFASPSLYFQTYACYNYPIYADHHLNPNPFHHQQNLTPVAEDPRVQMRRLGKRKAGAGGVIPFPTGPDQQDNKSSATPTTIMIKNILNQFRRSDLLNILTEHCLVENVDVMLRSDPNKSEFDFVYLPMNLNRGTKVLAAHYHNFDWDVQHNKKTCEITSARVQGKKALIRNFSHKVFWCECDEYLPVVVAPPCDGMSPPKLIVVGKLKGAPKHPTSSLK